MSFQSPAVYQKQRVPVNSESGNYYYGGDNSAGYYREGPYNDMATQGPDRGRGYNADSRGYGNYQETVDDRHYQQQSQEPSQYVQPPPNRYHREETIGHRYPATFQNPDGPAAPIQHYEGPQSTQDWRKGPQSVRNFRDDTYNISNQQGNQYSGNYGNRRDPSSNGPRSPVRSTQQDFNHKQQSQYRDPRSYGVENDRNNDQTYQDPGQRNHYSSDSNEQRRSGWDERRGMDETASDFRRNQDNWGQAFSRHDMGRASERIQSPEYVPNRQNEPQSPQQRQEHQSYREHDQGRPYNQYDEIPDRGPQHQPYRDSNHQVPTGNVGRPLDPPQVMAKTSGSSAVFGIVTKVDSSPTRHDFSSVAPPTNDYGSSYNPYPEQQQQRIQPRQRLSQSGPQQPSPPLSPRSRGHSQGPQWPAVNPEQQKQYGQQTDFNSNRQPNQMNLPHNIEAKPPQVTYNQPRYNDRPPPARVDNRFRDEYTESSGYGSESTHNTDRSYRDPVILGKDPYERRPYEDNRTNEGRSWNSSGRDPRGQNSYSQQQPQPPQDNYPNNYARDDRPLPPANTQPYSTRADNNFGYGHEPPLTGYNQIQRDYQDTRQAGQDAYNRAAAGPLSPNTGHFSGRDDTRPQWQGGNPESGVENSHVKSVRAVKDMFEKQTDHNRPPPGPKPITAPKPATASSMNTRPVPPRPRNLSDGGWNQHSERNSFPTSPQHQISHKSPVYSSRSHFEDRQPPYQQPPLSQSMDNLDDRSRYNPPKSINLRHPPQSQSMLNLDDRSRYDGYESNRPPDTQGYRNSYSGDSSNKPMVIAVKYNQDGGLTTYNSQDGQRSPPGRGRGRGSWRPQDEPKQFKPVQNHEPPRDFARDRPQNNSGRWSNEPGRNAPQQSYDGPRGVPSQQPSYNQPRQPASASDNMNYVPDVVARSYESFEQSHSVPKPKQGHSQGYGNPSQQGYDNRPGSQQTQQFDNRPRQTVIQDIQSASRSSVERWPTPPPPIQEPAPRNAESNYDNNHRVQPQAGYDDDWRRPGQPPRHVGPQQYQIRHGGDPPSSVPQSTDRNPPQSQVYRGGQSSMPRNPPPSHQIYQIDTDSSEGIDVDAPTPPPSNKQLRAPHVYNNRSESPYERNKPVPVTNRDSDTRWQGNQGQPHVPSVTFHDQRQEQRGVQQYIDPKVSIETKSPPPQKPQRNSVHVTSPPAVNGQKSPDNKQNEFKFDVGETQVLSHASSRERQRLGKSGALANRKPPSRQGSTSSLLEALEDDDFQIEVTDSDLTKHKPTPIEVHREESMRIIRAKNATSSHGKDTSSSSDVNSLLDRAAKEKNSRKSKDTVPKNDASPAKTNASSKKAETKLLFKIPSAEVARPEPVPEVKEPSEPLPRRPPTYMGFGNSSEKPKTDLLTQFKSARDSAMRSAAAKQDKALKSVSAMVKLSHGKKQPKSPPKPKLTAGERNAILLDNMNIELKAPPTEDDHRKHQHKHDERGDSKRSSTRSTSTVKAERYDGDDDTTNGSKYGKDRKGRGKDHHDDTRGKSRGRSRSRERAISPDDRGGKSRGRSRSRERVVSPDGRGGRSRGRSRSRERAISPDSRNKHRDRDYDDRRKYNDEPPYHRRSHSPDRHRYPESRHQRSPHHYQYPQPYGQHHHATREPDWVEKYRRGRDPQTARRAWVNDPRRVEVIPGGSRRELDMDAFEREVRRATSYNSDFEQPEPRRQMMPTKLMSRPPTSQKKPPGDWMNALKERNRSANRARPK